jgi:hypothetical protein
MIRAEDIDFPVSYDWARYYDPKLPPIDDRLPWQREESAKADKAIARAVREHESPEISPISRKEYYILSRRIDYHQGRINSFYLEMKELRKSLAVRQECRNIAKGGVEV